MKVYDDTDTGINGFCEPPVKRERPGGYLLP